MEIYAIDTVDIITPLCFSQILAKNTRNWKFPFSQQRLSLDSWAAKLASFWRQLLLHNAHLSDPFISEGHSSRVLFCTWGMPGTISFFQNSHSQFPLATRLITAPFHTSDTSEKKHTHTHKQECMPCTPTFPVAVQKWGRVVMTEKQKSDFSKEQQRQTRGKGGQNSTATCAL